MQGMHVSLTRVTTGDQPLENATIVGEELQRWLRDIDGFEGILMLYRPGTTIALTFWRAREIAEQHRMARMQFIERMTSVAQVEVQEIVDYELAHAALGAALAGADPA
jgi:hypothetical protein